MFLLDTLLKDKCMCLQGELNSKSLVLQDKYNIEIFLFPEIYIHDRFSCILAFCLISLS